MHGIHGKPTSLYFKVARKLCRARYRCLSILRDVQVPGSECCGVRTWNVLVSKLPVNILAEDVHAAFEDHFGFVHHVRIPKDKAGKPKTDKDGYAYAVVAFYRRGGARTKSGRDGSDSLIGVGHATAVRRGQELMKKTGPAT